MKHLYLLTIALALSTPAFSACSDEEVQKAIEVKELEERHNRHIEAAESLRLQAEQLDIQAAEIVAEIEAKSEEKADAR